MEFVYREIIRIGRLLYREGLVDARAGNLSYTLGDEIFITRTGSFLGDLGREDILRLPLRGDTILDGRASSELGVHRAIVLETSKRAVVHAHPPSCVVLSFYSAFIKPIDSEGRQILGEVYVVESIEEVAEALKECKVVVVRGHGAFSASASLWKAYSYVSCLEQSCKILLWDKVIGR